MLTILSHPRSKSSLLGCYLKNYKGEIFSLQDLDVEKLEINPFGSMTLKKVDPQPYVGRYLKHPAARLYLEKLADTLKPEDSVKVFYYQLNSHEKLFQLIQSKSTKNIELLRRHQLEAILSALLAARVGWTKQEENHKLKFEKFRVSSVEFILQKTLVVDHVKMGRSRLPVDLRLVSEDLNLELLKNQLGRWFQDSPEVVIEEQNTLRYVHLIENMEEVKGWARDLGLEPTT